MEALNIHEPEELYRENINDIIDLWGGYPLKDPCSQTPAINSGNVELRCYINNSCPFYSSPLTEDVLIFNDTTFKMIWESMPRDTRDVLMTTDGLPGIHFRPKYIFRNNYIFKFDRSVTETLPESNVELLGSKFDTFYKEINDVSTSPTLGANETRYKAEQSWISVPSVFDPVDESNTVEPQSEWTYIDKIISGLAVLDPDIMYDYLNDYYQEYIDSTDGKGNLLPGKKTRILPSHVQIPTQTKGRNDTGGVHWKLTKRTSLFKGEDFFIRFYKQSKEVSTNTNQMGPKSFTDLNYYPLDITATGEYEVFAISDLWRPVNDAVSTLDVVGAYQKSQVNNYNLFNQAYYVIELGLGSSNEHYFIIITERDHPIFVNFVNGAEGVSGSKRYSTFEQIKGGNLINEDYFDITVRNHLGSLVIQFGGKGLDNLPPWIVRKMDWEQGEDPITKKAVLVLKEKTDPLIVPRGRMSLWGGNVRSGFVFGPLQYQGGYIPFVFPPKESIRDQNKGAAVFNEAPPNFSSWEPIEETYDQNGMSAVFDSNPFFLPSQGNHHIYFSSTDVYVADFNNKYKEEPLFTHDAQYYKEYKEKYHLIDQASQYKLGKFFNGETIRDFPDPRTTIPYKTSNIVVKKNRYLNDLKSKKQAFDIWIGMMNGDHVFPNARWGEMTPEQKLQTVMPVKDAKKINTRDDVSKYNGQWFLPDCKTPILSFIRLVCDPSEETMWKDGTTIKDGIPLTPFEKKSKPSPGVPSEILKSQSKYLIEATNYIMNFSDSWSASDFSQIEHTGTLQFLVNPGYVSEGNISDILLSLQNKTFYVEIWAGYRICNFTNIPGFYRLFTGLCQGGQVDYQYGKNIMTCRVEDYSTVLKGMRIFNSPWFDGMKDINAISEIVKMVGFRDKGKYDPGSLIETLVQKANNGDSNVMHPHIDGRTFSSNPFVLPSAYTRLDQPAFKFNDGDSFLDAINKIATRAGKVFFFDQLGIAHYEEPQDLVEKDYMGLVPLEPLFKFTVNPEKYPGQLVFSKVERSYDVEGIFNHIKVMANTPDMQLLLKDDINWSSLENPESEGFLGFLKTGYDQGNMFGSKEAVLAYIDKFRTAFRPKINVSFETYGLPLRVNDIVSINDETTRVIKVDHNINAEKNEWWMNVECEKYQTVKPPETK